MFPNNRQGNSSQTISECPDDLEEGDSCASPTLVRPLGEDWTQLNICAYRRVDEGCHMEQTSCICFYTFQGEERITYK